MNWIWPGATKSKGFTIIELMVVVAIAGILIALAAPSFTHMLDSNKLANAVQAFVSNLQQARFEASKRNANIFISFTPGDTWTYSVCTNAACSEGAVLITAQSSDYDGVITTSSLDGTNPYFDPKQGMFTGTNTICSPNQECVGKTTFTLSQVGSVEVQIFKFGLIRACSPTSAVSGFPVCQNILGSI